MGAGLRSTKGYPKRNQKRGETGKGVRERRMLPKNTQEYPNLPKATVGYPKQGDRLTRKSGPGERERTEEEVSHS